MQIQNEERHKYKVKNWASKDLILGPDWAASQIRWLGTDGVRKRKGGEKWRTGGSWRIMHSGEKHCTAEKRWKVEKSTARWRKGEKWSSGKLWFLAALRKPPTWWCHPSNHQGVKGGAIYRRRNSKVEFFNPGEMKVQRCLARTSCYWLISSIESWVLITFIHQ